MPLCILTSAFFSQTLIAGLCYALNVTVYPSPWALHPLGGNATIWCAASQKRKSDSLLTVRWVFSPGPGTEQTIGRVTKYGNRHISTNWSRRGELSSESPGHIYRLMLTYLHPSDEGQYICRVQEVSQYRKRWSAVSNGTASTQLKVTALIEPEERQLLSWTLFQDLYLYGVLLCSLGILSVLTFFLILLCQTMKRRHSKETWKCTQKRHYDVSAPDVMPVVPPKKGKKKKKDEEDVPPSIPIKGPFISLEKKTRQPLQLPHIARLKEDGLAYAELELINHTPTVKDSSSTSSTVYAQIKFEENTLKQQKEITGQKIVDLRPVGDYKK